MALSNSSLCVYERDCPGNEICYRNVTWRSDGCGCSTYYGFKRNPITLQCSDLDKTAQFVIITSALNMLLIAVVLMVFVIDSCKLFFLIIFNYYFANN